MTSLESRIRGAALGALRRLKRWSGLRLAEAVGTSEAMISHYETGSKELSVERFQEIGQAMGYSRRRLDAARFGLGVSLRELEGTASEAATGARAEAGSEAEERSEGEALSRRLAAEMAGLAASRTIDRALQSAHLRRRAKRERAQAEEICRRLSKLPPAQQGIWITEDPVFQGWAVIERLGEMSATAASSSPARAKQLACWAKQAAEAGPDTPDKPRRIGYAGFFVGNALRVSGKLKAAQAEFEAAWAHWKEGEVTGVPPLARWRPFDLEASLRRDQQLWLAAISLVDRALALAPPSARSRLLLQKASCLQMSGAYALAIPVVTEASSLILPDTEQRLAYATHWIFAACLYETGRLQEADAQLAPARTLALELESSLDLARCDWLGARVSAKRGLKIEALAGFARAREAFAAHSMALDCAAVALHESIVLLEEGQILRVKRTAASIAWTFSGQGIEREGREAVELFCRAAEREEATIALARWAFARLNPAPTPGEAARS